ncbi:MAG TPA: hypothetical protein VGM62_08430 [Chthoniobacterales bacterium]
MSRGPRQLGLFTRECVRLRVKDVDFSYAHIIVRDGKGAKDRITMLPVHLVPALRRHLCKMKAQHEEDLDSGFGSVYLPTALERKYPRASREWIWQYVFPSTRLSRDLREATPGEDHRPAADATAAGEDHRPAADATRAGEDHRPATDATTAAGEDHRPATDATTAAEDHRPAADATAAGEDHRPAADATAAGEDHRPATDATLKCPDQCCLATDSTPARNSSSSIGLRKKADAPAPIASVRTDGSSLLVITMTRVEGEMSPSRF